MCSKSMSEILYCHIKVMMVMMNNTLKLQILGKKVQGISHNNKSILTVMGMFVVISITRAQCGIIAKGT